MSHPKQVRLAGSVLDRSRHVCAFFHSKEEHRVLLPFIKEGFEQGDRAFHIIDAHRRQDHMRRLQAADMDTAGAEAEERLVIRHWEDTYLQARPTNFCASCVNGPGRTARVSVERPGNDETCV
jgi:hypothetical protein